MIRGWVRAFRFLVSLIKAFGQRHFRLFIFGTFLGVFCFFVFFRVFLSPLPKRQIRIGLVGRFPESEIPDEITQLASRGLTKLLPEGVATSSLAKSWEVFEDGKVYKFYLQDNVLWQDGTQFTAKDVTYEFKHAQMETVSDFQIKIVLKEPYSALPALLSRPIFKKGLVGIGDYQIVKLKKAGRFLQEIVLQPDKTADLPDLTYRFYFTQQAARIAFKLGEIDVLKNIDEPGELKNWPGIKVDATIHKNRYAALFFNSKNPKFEQKRFRQALAYAVEKPGGEKRAYGPISPLSWAYNSDLKPYYQDLDYAQEILDKVEPQDSIKLFSFVSLIGQAEKIKRDWEKLGLETEIKIINSLPDDFEALLAVWEIPPDPDQYAFWHSTQKTNISGVTNPKIDKLLEEGRRSLVPEERKESYLEFQKTLVEECPAIFLFHPVTYTVRRD